MVSRPLEVLDYALASAFERREQLGALEEIAQWLAKQLKRQEVGAEAVAEALGRIQCLHEAAAVVYGAGEAAEGLRRSSV